MWLLCSQVDVDAGRCAPQGYDGVYIAVHHAIITLTLLNLSALLYGVPRTVSLIGAHTQAGIVYAAMSTACIPACPFQEAV